jgi:DNA-binding NtrC family response regulator
VSTDAEQMNGAQELQAQVGRVLLIAPAASWPLLEAALGARFELVLREQLSEAEVELASAPFDVTLAEEQLPDGSGLEFLDRLHRRSPDIGLILALDHISQEPWTRPQLLRIIFKPYDPDGLFAWVSLTASIARVRRGARRLAGQLSGSERHTSSRR